MVRNVRWVLAGLVVAVAFAVPACLGGALVLTSLLKDSAIRWSLASVLGAVLARCLSCGAAPFATRLRGPTPRVQVAGDGTVWFQSTAGELAGAAAMASRGEKRDDVVQGKGVARVVRQRTLFRLLLVQ